MTSCLRNALEFPLKTQGNYSLISQHRLHERQEHIQAGNTAFLKKNIYIYFHQPHALNYATSYNYSNNLC